MTGRTHEAPTSGATGPVGAAGVVERGGTLDSWVRAAAARTPDAIAIEVAGQRLTYAELMDLADRLASRLAHAAGRPPRAVGLLARHSLAAYAGYLAALRCGATVVPLNPRFPATRNATMCRLAGVDVVIVDDEGAGHAAEVVASGPITPVALLAESDWTWRHDLRGRPWDGDGPAGPDAVAYTLFTSGSTGEPKGVPIRHRNLRDYLALCADRYQVGPGARVSQMFELTFDPSVYDMFVTWCAGATLVVPREEEILTPARYVADSGVTHWFSVPSVVSIARRLRQLRPGCMPDLRWSLFGGEQLPFDLARAWQAAAPNSIVANLYGPTEITISCVHHELPADPREWRETANGTVPIGTVHPHLEHVVLGEDGLPADDGELCLRGSQLFGGYLVPEHDAGRFLRHSGRAGDRAEVLTDPVPEPGRWYRTGDRVRSEDGALVHLGRLDDQVKVSGYRIELGEIETALRAHPAVADAVVLAVRGAVETELHAVYTGAPVPDGGFAAVLAALPTYMRPLSYQRRDAIPTNMNGKVDRRRLTAERSAELIAAGPVTPD